MAKPSNRNLRGKVDAMITAPCQRCSQNAGRLITAGHCRDIDAPPKQNELNVRNQHAPSFLSYNLHPMECTCGSSNANAMTLFKQKQKCKGNTLFGESTLLRVSMHAIVLILAMCQRARTRQTCRPSSVLFLSKHGTDTAQTGVHLHRSRDPSSSPPT